MAASPGTSNSQRCSWCGTTVAVGDGLWAAEHPGERMAVFCRLEHIVPWTIQGAHWQVGTPQEPRAVAAQHDACAQCGAALGDVYILLVRHRGEHRVPDAFCSAAHMSDWAKGGGTVAVMDGGPRTAMMDGGPRTADGGGPA